MCIFDAAHGHSSFNFIISCIHSFPVQREYFAILKSQAKILTWLRVTLSCLIYVMYPAVMLLIYGLLVINLDAFHIC